MDVLSLIRLIPFKVQIISGKEWGELENITMVRENPHTSLTYPRPEGHRVKEYTPANPTLWVDNDGWPMDDFSTGAIGTVVGYSGGLYGYGDGKYLVCFPNEMPKWYSGQWLKVVEGQDA